MNAPAPQTVSVASRLLAFLQIIRPAGALTAAADALAGMSVAWGITIEGYHAGLWRLPVAAFLLYAGGVTLNDVCDADADRLSRPRRPIPRGHISWRAGLLFSIALLGTGVFVAAGYSRESRLLSVILIALIILYDLHAKHRPILGPFCLGLCRSGSLLLGMTASIGGIAQGWPLAVIPLGYIVAVTLVSRGEHNGRNPIGIAALGLFVLVAIAYGFLAITREQWPALAFVALFAILVWPPFVRAAEKPSPAAIQEAMKAGVLSLVICDATLASAFAGPITALAILLLLPMSRGLARIFPMA